MSRIIAHFLLGSLYDLSQAEGGGSSAPHDSPTPRSAPGDRRRLGDWKRNTDYTDYLSSDPVIIWFWKAVEKYDNEMRGRLLQFATGTSRVPINGFAELQGSQGLRKFCVKKFGEPNSPPRAHTW